LEVDGRLARAITMLSNSRADMGQHLGRITSRLAAVQLHAETPEAAADPERRFGIL